MNQPYILKWTSKITGYSGSGTHAFPNKTTIDHFINEMIKTHPNIINEAIIAPIGTPLLKINTPCLT